MDLFNMMMPYTMTQEMDPWMQPFTTTMQPFGTTQRRRMRTGNVPALLEADCYEKKDGE